MELIISIIDKHYDHLYRFCQYIKTGIHHHIISYIMYAAKVKKSADVPP